MSVFSGDIRMNGAPAAAALGPGAQAVSAIAYDPDLGTRTITRSADDDDSCRRNLREAQGRAWAGEHGIRTPAVLGHAWDGSELVSEYVEPLRSEGRDYVEAAIAAAYAISGAPDPVLGAAASQWRAPRATLPLRVARLAAAGVDPVRFLHARRNSTRIPPQVTVHGDFHDGNVLNLGSGAVSVLDFEHAGRGPRHADALRLITTLEVPSDAEHGLELVLRDAAREDRESIADQLEWLALRHLADLATGRVHRRRVDAARRRWISTRDQAREIRRVRK